MNIALITGSCGLVGSEASILFARKGFKILGSAHNLKEIVVKELQNVEEVFLSPLFKNKKNPQLNFQILVLKNQVACKPN